MYAVIETGGKQYTVKEGEFVFVERLDAEVGDKVEFDKVLFVSADTVSVGDPLVNGAKVEGTVEEQGKNKKVIVYRYRAKKGYRKKNGHRQPFTKVKIDRIQA